MCHRVSLRRSPRADVEIRRAFRWNVEYRKRFIGSSDWNEKISVCDLPRKATLIHRLTNSLFIRSRSSGQLNKRVSCRRHRNTRVAASTEIISGARASVSWPATEEIDGTLFCTSNRNRLTDLERLKKKTKTRSQLKIPLEWNSGLTINLISVSFFHRWRRFYR